jgi:peptide/nickel transport system substrate-binding protein
MKKFRLIILLLLFPLAFAAASAAVEATTSTASETEMRGDIPTTWLEARTASQLGITSFDEAPMLAELVRREELPPVEQRLPDDPLVLEPLNEIGRYGGTIRASNNSSSGWSDLGHVRLSYLFTTDPSCSAVIPDVAKGYDLSPDGKELTIYLREGMNWSDGAPLTADDIMFYYNDYMLNEEVNYWTRFVWTIGGEVAKFEKIDDYAFRIRMAIPYRPVLSMINHWYTLPSFFIMPQHYAKQFHKDYNPDADKLAKELGYESWTDALTAENYSFPVAGAMKKVPTIGPWVLEEDTQLKKKFVRNPYYHVVDTEGNQLPYIDRLEVNIVSSQEVTILDALQGKVDVAGRLLKPTELQLYKQNEERGNYRLLDWQKIRGADPSLTFNQNHKDPARREIFQNVKFRQAVSLAINREEMNELLYLGLAVPQQATIHYGASFYDPKWATHFAEYDPDRANALLDEIGLRKGSDGFRRFANGDDFRLNIDVGEEKVEAAELIKDYWQAVGVRVDLKTVSGELISQRVNAGEFDVRVSHTNRLLELRSYVPDSTPFDITASVWGQRWAEWFKWNIWDQAGRIGDEPPQGEEPPAHVKAYWESYQNSLKAVSDEDYMKYRREVWDFFAEDLTVIGTVAWPPAPVMVANRLHNVLETAIFSDDLSWFKVSQPTQWWVDE